MRFFGDSGEMKALAAMLLPLDFGARINETNSIRTTD